MWTFRAPISAIVSRAMRKSSSSNSSCPTSCSASCWFGDTSQGSASSPSRGGVEAVRDAAGERAGEHDSFRTPREVAHLVEEHLELGLGHLRPPFVDLRLGAGGRIHDERRRTRLLPNPDEV